MKKRRILNSVSFLVQGVQLFLCCCAKILEIHLTFSGAYTIKHPVFDGRYTFLEVLSREFIPLLTVSLILMAFNLCLCLVGAISKKTKKDGIVHIIIPILILVTNVMCFGEGFLILSDYETTFMPPFDIIHWALIGILILLALIKRSANVVGEPETKVEKTVVKQTIVETTNADEIKKYKELLDMGAITQEEFDEKKKALLNQ